MAEGTKDLNKSTQSVSHVSTRGYADSKRVPTMSTGNVKKVKSPKDSHSRRPVEKQDSTQFGKKNATRARGAPRLWQKI